MAVRDSYSIVSDRKRGSAPAIVKLGLVLFYWVCFGFALGTFAFLRPAWRWLEFCREHSIRPGNESGGIVLMILLVVATSMSLALWVSTAWVRSPRFLVRLALPLLGILPAVWAWQFWAEPVERHPAMVAEVVVNERFTVGPYPDEVRLSGLREEGYTGIVSLLHPAVIPFEPVLIQRQVDMVREAGLEFHHVPMLPWVSENRMSLEEIEELAGQEGGRYYVHGYFGRYRVHDARLAIEKAMPPEGGRLSNTDEAVTIAGTRFLPPMPDRTNVPEVAR